MSLQCLRTCLLLRWKGTFRKIKNVCYICLKCVALFLMQEALHGFNLLFWAGEACLLAVKGDFFQE